MRRRLAPLLLLLTSGATACSAARAPRPASPAPPSAAEVRAGLDAFNRAMIDASTRMDNAAVVALWEDDGASLLPESRPVEGKHAIAALYDEVSAQSPGARMRSFEMRCAGMESFGDMATEYCDEHQVVDLGADRPPFEGFGRMLFVLHRGAGGAWRLRRAMWQPGAVPPGPEDSAPQTPAPAVGPTTPPPPATTPPK